MIFFLQKSLFTQVSKNMENYDNQMQFLLKCHFLIDTKKKLR